MYTEHNIEPGKKTTEKAQRSIAALFKPADIDKSTKKPLQRKYDFARVLAIVCALDFESFNITQRKGFQFLCQYLKVAELPTSQTVGNTALIDVYNFFLNQV